MSLSKLERVKQLKKLKELFNSKATSKGLEKAKILKTILEIRQLLGMGNPANDTADNQSPNAVYQAVIDGSKKLSVETLRDVLNEAISDPSHYQLIPATQKLLDEYNASNDSDLSNSNVA